MEAGVQQESSGSRKETSIPAPAAPGDPDAWYAPDVRAQYEVTPGVVATVRETGEGFAYGVREPSRKPAEDAALDAIADHFADAKLTRPHTREGAAERMAAGFGEKYRRIVDRLVDCSRPARRRVEYYACRDLRALGEVTPLALDDAVEVGDATGDRLVVHTRDFAPCHTGYPTDVEYRTRFLAERVDRHTVDFRDFEIPVVVYRERLLGSDDFDTKYAVLEPDLLPGDRELVETCKERVWEANVDDLADGDRTAAVEDHAAFVRERAEQFFARQLTARNASAYLDAARHRLQQALADHGLRVPPVDDRYASDRLDDLVYYVLRDYVGDDKLTVPIRDPYLEDVEANRVGERVKVVPRRRVHDERLPTNLVFDSESRFVNLVTQLAASDGVELNASNPSAKVNLAPAEVDDDVTIRCAVALPVISEDGPHISVRKQAPDPMTPVDLLERDALPTELVALLWLLYEHHGVVLFSGPTGVGKTTLLNAHMPFVPYHDRPISIDEGSREVRLPQETGVSLTTRAHQSEFKRVTMADLMTEANYLNPDVEVIAEINTPASFETFGEAIQTGHGLLGTTHAEDPATFVNRVVEQGLPPHLLAEVDLVVFPRHVAGERFVGSAVEFVPGTHATAGTEAVERSGSRVHYNRVLDRRPDDTYAFAYDHPNLGDDCRAADVRVFERLAERENRTVDDVEAEFHRKHRYVRYLVQEGVDDADELLGFLTDLRNEEEATVERLANRD